MQRAVTDDAVAADGGTTAAPADDDVPAGADGRARRLAWGADVGVPAAIRVGEMLLQLLFLSWLDPAGGPALSKLLTKWDAVYYGTIASTGYPHGVTLAPDGTLATGYEFAFYPTYPLLAGIADHLGLSTTHALLLTAAVCGVVASSLVHLLTLELTGSRRAGWCAAALLGALPMAVALQMGYAESLFVAVTAATLLAAARGNWAAAAALALAAGLTRPGGILVPLAIPLAAFALRRHRPVAWARVVGATVVGLLGSPLYWAYLWWRTGRADTWFFVEKHGWDSHVDVGHQTWDFLRLAVTQPDTVQFMGVGAVVSIVVIGGGCLVAAARRQYLPIVVLCLLGAAMTLGATNYWHSKPRLLLACFPLVVLAGPVVARWRTSTAVLAVGGAVAASCWYGAYALDVWRYAI
ncbi:MAG: hypothetical protein ACTHMS_22285 [Jatrophihabitans sp.]|uniref:hypothetical protein n=1 Tax=Jatrophihabitans sp. TaxID=1932789 RepID=UPI003F7F6830